MAALCLQSVDAPAPLEGTFRAQRQARPSPPDRTVPVEEGEQGLEVVLRDVNEIYQAALLLVAR